MNTNYIQFLENLLLVLKREGASDLHLSHGRKPIMRVEGDLITMENYDVLSKDDTFNILKELVDEQKISNILHREEIDFSYSYKGEMRLRASAYLQDEGINLAFRVIQEVRELEDLNLPPILETFAQKEQGLFLIVGPVGQGKSTTMAAIISKINQSRKERIITIENPVEYLFRDNLSIIEQREVGADTLSFETGLKSLFRQDVNVIMVGEMRNPETISTVVTAAETGHLVFSTLHTNNAAQTVDRIIDSFPAAQQNQVRTQLAGSLIGIFSQRLLKSQRGGMVPVYELMINTPGIANLIREGRTHEINTLIETGFEHGMIDMNRSLLELVQTGHITIDDARRHSLNPKLLDSMI